MGKYDPAPTMAAGLLRLARDKAELTQADLAERAGLSQQAISAYETGRKDPTINTLIRILRAAGFEMRVHLSPLDDHDASVERFVENLAPETRAALDEAQRRRVEAARLSRVRKR